jgi:hypothetical protein
MNKNKQQPSKPDIHITAEQAQALRPLMWQPCPLGNTWVGLGIKVNPKYALCISCGAKDAHVMIRKHKRGCPYIAWCKALELFREILGER